MTGMDGEEVVDWNEYRLSVQRTKMEELKRAMAATVIQSGPGGHCTVCGSTVSGEGGNGRWFETENGSECARCHGERAKGWTAGRSGDDYEGIVLSQMMERKGRSEGMRSGGKTKRSSVATSSGNGEGDEGGAGRECSTEFEVESVIGWRVQKDLREYYLVKWKGYDLKESTWVPGEGMANAMEEVLKFKEKVTSNANTVCTEHHETESIVPCWSCAGNNNSGLLRVEDVPFDCAIY